MWNANGDIARCVDSKAARQDVIWRHSGGSVGEIDRTVRRTADGVEALIKAVLLVVCSPLNDEAAARRRFELKSVVFTCIAAGLIDLGPGRDDLASVVEHLEIQISINWTDIVVDGRLGDDVAAAAQRNDLQVFGEFPIQKVACGLGTCLCGSPTTGQIRVDASAGIVGAAQGQRVGSGNAVVDGGNLDALNSRQTSDRIALSMRPCRRSQ